MFSCLASLVIDAQVISGRILDENRQPISFANVIAYSKNDSVFVNGVVSNEDGTFTVAADCSEVFLKVSSVGYVTRNICCQSNEVGDISMFVDENLLGEVVVKGNIPTHRLTSEGLQTNVYGTLLGKLGTANDVLSHVPGLQKDGDAYKVFGKDAPVFYINGRLVRNLSELDQLKSDDIKDITLITNPGAEYDASVRAVVKIKTKRVQGDGFGFDNQIVYSQCENADFTEQLDFNYRYRGLDLFGMFYYTKEKSYNRSAIEQDIQADVNWHQTNTNDYTFRSIQVGGEVGMNYAIDDDNSLGFRYEIYKNPDVTDYDTFTSIVTADGNPYDYLYNTSEFKSHERPMHSANVYYNGKIGGTSIDFNADWQQNDKYYNSIYHEVSDEYEDRTVTTQNYVKNVLLAAKLIASRPLFGGTLSVGAEYTHTKRNDDYANPEGYLETNYTVLKDQSIAPFVEYTRQIPIGMVKAGLRYEHAQFDYYVDGSYLNEQSRSFDNLFPSLSVMANIGKVQGMFGYTAKIRRPTYTELRSNMSYANRFTLEVGNPFLKPSIIHDFSVQAMWKIWNLNISYSDTHDAVIDWAEQQEENTSVSILGKKNINSLKNLTAYIVAAPVWGIWHPQFVAGISKQWLTLDTAQGKIKMNSPICIGQINNTFQFSDTFIGSLVIKYTSTGDNKNITLMRDMFQTDISLTKTFFKDRFSVGIAGYDLFRTKQKVKLFNQQMQFVQENVRDTRYVGVTLRYSFNTTQSKYKGTGAGNAEKDRF